MILFNLTCHIEKSIDKSFRMWTKEYYLPKLMDSNFLDDALLLKLLTEIDDQTYTYSIQMKFKSMIYYEQFQIELEDILLNEIQQNFEGKIFTFTTLLESV